MNLKQNLRFEQLRDEAIKEHNKMAERLDGIGYILRERLDGRNSSSLLGAVVVSVAYIVGAVCLYFMVQNTMGSYTMLNLAALLVSIAFFGLLTYRNVQSKNYYGKLLEVQERLHELSGRISLSKGCMHAKLDEYTRKETNGWESPIGAVDSIPHSVAGIEDQIRNIEASESGWLNSLCTVLYYATSILVALVGSIAFSNLGVSILYSLPDMMPSEAVSGISVLCIGAACIAEGFVAAKFWSGTDCKVNNITALAVLMGPLLYFVAIIVALIIAMAIMLVIAIVQFIIGVIAAIIGVVCVGAIAIGLMSGG